MLGMKEHGAEGGAYLRSRPTRRAVPGPLGTLPAAPVTKKMVLLSGPEEM